MTRRTITPEFSSSKSPPRKNLRSPAVQVVGATVTRPRRSEAKAKEPSIWGSPVGPEAVLIGPPDKQPPIDRLQGTATRTAARLILGLMRLITGSRSRLLWMEVTG
jgi:hypothetical protein